MKSILSNLFKKLQKIYLSVISEIELLSYPQLTQSDEIVIKEFVSCCDSINLNEKIINYTIDYRKNSNLKIPDAIIAASAKYLGVNLVTADLELIKN